MVPRRLIALILAVVAAGSAPGRLHAQDAPAGGIAGREGFALSSHLLTTKPWTITEYMEYGPVTHTTDGAGGVGLSLSYTVHPLLALFLTADASLYGDLSGYTIYAAGAGFRLPLTNRLAVSLNGSLGRFSASSRTTFNLGGLDAGLEFFILRRLSLTAGIQSLRALGDGRRGDIFVSTDERRSVRATLDNDLKRKRFGLHWYLGKG